MRSLALVLPLAAILALFAATAGVADVYTRGQPGQFFAPASPGAGPEMAAPYSIQPGTTVPAGTTYVYPYGTTAGYAQCPARTCPQYVAPACPCPAVRVYNPCVVCP